MATIKYTSCDDLAYNLARAIGPMDDGQAVVCTDLAEVIEAWMYAKGQWAVDIEVIGRHDGCPVVQVSCFESPVLCTNAATVWEVQP